MNRAAIYNAAFPSGAPFRDDQDFEDNASEEQHARLVEWSISEVETDVRGGMGRTPEPLSAALDVLAHYARKGVKPDGE